MTKKLPSLLEMMHTLVSTPSVSSVHPAFDSDNREVINRLAEWFDEIGFHVEIMPLSAHANKANLIATLGQGSGGLVLAGHTDTVPYDASHWNFDPFALTQQQDRLIGLGTADMKSFFALVLEVVQELEASKLTAPVIVVATADEESSMDGARLLVQSGSPQGRYAIIGEPTGLKPIRLHKGMMMESIRIIGQSGHSSDPSLGSNALEAMHEVIAELIHWRTSLQAAYVNHQFAVPYPTLNLGHIHGGDNPNRICAECELHIDLRPLPGMSLTALRSELQQRVQQRLQGRDVQVDIQPLFEGIEAFETDEQARLVRLVEQLTQSQAGAVAFGTEGPFFNQLGHETIILGPGSIDQAHQPDEYLSLSQINPTLSLLRKTVKTFCMAE